MDDQARDLGRSTRAIVTEMRPNARRVVAMALFGSALIMLMGCSSAPIPPTYTQDELKARCESRYGQWYDGDPMRSFCDRR